jgi:hypothetical protein
MRDTLTSNDLSTSHRPRVFSQSYMADTSSINSQAAFLSEISDHIHIDYFQSLERFRKRGLPYELPTKTEQRLNDSMNSNGGANAYSQKLDSFKRGQTLFGELPWNFKTLKSPIVSRGLGLGT